MSDAQHPDASAVQYRMRAVLALLVSALLLHGAPPAGAAVLSGAKSAASGAGFAVAWTEYDEGDRPAVRFATAGADGLFGAPAAIPGSEGRSIVALEMSDAGDLLAVLSRLDPDEVAAGGPPRPYVEAVVRPAGGSFGPVLALSREGRTPTTETVVALSRTGRAAVGWTQGGAGGASQSGSEARLVIWSLGQAPPAPEPVGDLKGVSRVGVADDGTVVVGGVANCTNAGCDVVAVVRAPDGTVGPPRRLGAPGASYAAPPVVAIGPAGDVLAVANTAHPERALDATRRPRGGDFGGDERLDAGPAGPLDGAVTASGQSLVVWNRSPSGTFFASAEPGEPFSSPQSLPVGGGLAGLGAAADGSATVRLAENETIRLVERRPGQPFTHTGDISAGDFSESFGASTGAAGTALAGTDTSFDPATNLSKDRLTVVTTAFAGPRPSQLLATATRSSPTSPPPAPYGIPKRVRALERRGRVVRVPVSCPESCVGRVAIRGERVVFSVPHGDEGTFVRVPVPRGLRRVTVRVRMFRRRIAPRTLAVRLRPVPACPRRPWATVVARGSRTTVSTTGPYIGTRIFACRPNTGERRLVTLPHEDFTNEGILLEARAGARSVALLSAQGGRQGSSTHLALYDARTGVELLDLPLHSRSGYDPYPPAFAVHGLALTRAGHAAAAVRTGATVQIRVFLRSGKVRVLDPGPRVDEESVRVSGDTVTWTTEGRPQARSL